MRASSSLLRVHEGEARIVALVTTLTFVTLAGGTIGESGVNALFFERVGADALPVMYLLQAGAVFVVMLLLTGVLGRVDSRRTYVAVPLALGLIIVIERIGLTSDMRWIFVVLWLTNSLAWVLLGLCTWGVAGLVTDTRQAKRLFPLFAASGILGSVVGGLITRPLASLIGAQNLLLVWVATLMFAYVLTHLVVSSGQRPTRRGHRASGRSSALREMREGFGHIRSSPLLVWMTAAAVLFSILYYLLYLPWARAAVATYPDAEDLAGFFGLFWAGLTGAAFLVSIGATNRILGRFGAAAAVLILPFLYLGAFGTTLISSTFVALVLLRFLMGIWLQAVASPAWESLINVTPTARRDQIRLFLNGGPTQVGTALAGVIGLIEQQALSPRGLSIVGLVLAGVTLVVALRIRSSYAQALVDALRAGRPLIFDPPPVPGSPVAAEADAETLRACADAIAADDPSVRRLAVSLLAGSHEPLATDRLKLATQDADPDVRRIALEALARSSAHPFAGFDTILRAAMDDDELPVAMTAAAMSLATILREEALIFLEAALAADDTGRREAALLALPHAPHNDALDLASPLLDDPGAAIRAAALLVVSGADPMRALEPATDMLLSDEPRVAAAAATAALRADGAAVAPVLGLLDRSPLARVPLDVLSRLDARPHAAVVEAFARDRTLRATQDYELSSSIVGDDEASDFLRAALLARGRRHARAAFLALASISGGPDAIRTSVDSLDTTDAGQLANALETLETVVDTRVARSLIPLWEARPGPLADAQPSALDRAGEDEDELIRLCVTNVRARLEDGDDEMRTQATTSRMERLLFLRRVPIFSRLEPADLDAVARVVEDHSFSDEERLAHEGELGDRFHLILSGSVQVVRGDPETEIARRGQGEVVGEMSLVSNEPRIASLVAVGDVRTISLGQLEFEGIIRERPDVGLSVMKVLASRLAESSRLEAATE